jgi:pimeloyl-ACP methyl ester carboxylesterase
MLTEQFATVEELRLNYASGPATGPPLVLLHGVARRWQDFLPLLPSLAFRWQVLALDFRGHGRSARTRGQYLVRDYVRDTVAFLERELSRPAVIYGHSLGALVAAAVAAVAPDAVQALVLEDPPAEGFVKGIRDTTSHALFVAMRDLARQNLPVGELAHQLGQVPFSPQRGGVLLPLSHFRDATSLRFSARCLQNMDPEVLTPLIQGRWLDNYPVDDTYQKISCPTLLLAADEEVGGMLPRSDAEHLAALIKDCVHITLPRVGHLVHWLQPDTTLRLVTGFLESL